MKMKILKKSDGKKGLYFDAAYYVCTMYKLCSFCKLFLIEFEFFFLETHNWAHQSLVDGALNTSWP